MILQTIDELTCADFQQRIFVVANFASEGAAPHVRFGSKADMTLLNFDVRFTPNSGHPSAQSKCPLYPPKADIRSRDRDVCFGPKGDILVFTRSLGASWRISSSEGYRNTHQGAADGYHCKAHCPWPKPCMTRKNESTKK
jgi:hypothetical protein